jgi:AcrR family transcriptional regulator
LPVRRRRKNPATAPRKAPRQQRSRETVAAILDATARVLVRHGYAGTNTNRVAEAAGVSVGSLYQYFPSKESLVAALHERHARELLAVLDEVVASAPHRSFDATVRALIHGILEAHLVDPALHRVLEGEVPELDCFEGVTDLDAAIFAKGRALLALHRARIAPPNLDLAAHVVMRIVDGLVHAAVIDAPDGQSPRTLEREIERAVLGYLGRT